MDLNEQLKRAVDLQTKMSSEVKRLMEPGLHALGIDYFWFVRLLEGQFHISVGIEPPLVSLYQKRKTPELFFNNKSILAQRQTTVFWDLHQRETLTDDMKTQLGLAQGICIFRRKQQAVDVFYLACTKVCTSNIYDLYLNNPNMMFRLILFFQERVLPILPMNQRDFLLPYMDGYVMKLPSECAHGSGAGGGKFHDATHLKSFTLRDGANITTLSCRELQCLYHAAKGSTSKEIGKILELSFRTVEHYLLNIRNKTNCKDKSELIELFRKNDFMMWFDISAP
jgi:DNA-binding CsgD family transcriptional regulator